MQTTQPESRPQHPVVVAHQAQRAADLQLRIADAITAFAGSMPFVYIHAVLLGIWMLFIESDPWPKLTLIVSLVAIFLGSGTHCGRGLRFVTVDRIGFESWTGPRQRPDSRSLLIKDASSGALICRSWGTSCR